MELIKSRSGEGWQWERYRLTELEALPYVKFNPKVNKQYSIIRRQGHDGTFLFTLDKINEIKAALAYRTSFYKPEPPSNMELIEYEIGYLDVATVFGRVDLRCGDYPGQRESFRLKIRQHLKQCKKLTGKE